MPEYAEELRQRVHALQLDEVVRFLGNRTDAPRLLSGLDGLVLVAQGEGMPHIIAEAGAAYLPVVATKDNGTAEQIEDGVSEIVVPYQSPPAVAVALERLIADPRLRQTLGTNLRRKVEQDYSTDAVIPLWEKTFEEVLAEVKH
jgi:glycosyltransferase involved in cell wall biosynthesis